MISFSARTHTYTCACAYWIFLYFHTMSVIWHTDLLYHGVTGCNWCTTGCFSELCSIIESSCSRRAICWSWHVKSRQITHSSVFHYTSKSTFQMSQAAVEDCFMKEPLSLLENVSSTVIFCVNQNLSVKLLLTKWTLLSKWCFTSLNWS